VILSKSKKGRNYFVVYEKSRDILLVEIPPLLTTQSQTLMTIELEPEILIPSKDSKPWLREFDCGSLLFYIFYQSYSLAESDILSWSLYKLDSIENVFNS